MPYKIQKPNKCKKCFIPICRGSKYCSKDVPRTKEWINNLAMSLSKSLKGKPKPKGDKSNNWKGGRTKTTFGYMYVISPEHPFRNCNNYVMEHRLVMEKKLGRYLTKYENIHHKNGIKNDNRVENLQLLTASEHMKLHAKDKIRNKKGTFINNPEEQDGQIPF